MEIGSGTALENLRFETNQEKFKNPYVGKQKKVVIIYIGDKCSYYPNF